MEKEAFPINGKNFKIKDQFSKQDFIEKENVFVRHDALLKAAKNVLGVRGKKVQVLESPNKQNEWSTVAIVTYEFNDGFSFSASAEARITNVDKFMAPYTVTLAETRASSRALRFALGVDFCSYEELADVKNIDKILEEDGQIDDQQLRVIKKFIDKGISQEKILSLAKVPSLNDLKQSQASELIGKLNKLINK